MSPHLLINFEIQRYFQNELKFKGVYSRNNLPKMKDGEFVTGYNEYKLTRTQQLPLYADSNSLKYFGSFGFWSLIHSRRNEKTHRQKNNKYLTHIYNKYI